MMREERMQELLYSNEGRVEQCERICNLEELVVDLWGELFTANLEIVAPTGQGYDWPFHLEERAKELGIVVPDAYV